MLNKIFKNKYILLFLQVINLIVFIAIIYASIGITTNDADFAKILRNTNFANLIVWSYWWPLIILTAILFGRFWCSICPMELLTSLFGMIGLKKKPGKILKSAWIITIFYAVILILGIHSLAIHRIPQYMAIYMLSLLFISVIVGLIWEKRTFCTYICPIGHLLGLYSLLSFFKLRVKDKTICDNCMTKDCISKKNHCKIVARSCTSELYPAKIKDNRSCILCGQCFSSCQKDNIAIQKQKINTNKLLNIRLSWAEIVFFMMISAFVVYEILSESHISKQILMIVPSWTNKFLNIPASLHGTVKALILFVLFPAVFYFFMAFVKRLFVKEKLKTSFMQFVIALLPITASMHLLKALLKTFSRLPYWKFVFNDYKGIDTAEMIMKNESCIKSEFLTTISPIFSIFSVVLIIGGLALSIFINRKLKPIGSKYFAFVVALIYFAIFFVAFIV